MQETRKLLLFIKKSNSTFVINDENFLKKHYRVKSFLYGNPKGLRKFLNVQIKLVLWLLSKIREASYIYVWFADYHSFISILFAKIAKRGSLLVLGGYGIAKIPDINYGAQTNALRKFCVRYSISKTSICLPVSHYIEKKATLLTKDFRSKVIYNGIKINNFKRVLHKSNIILTAGICNEVKRIHIKGIDFFIQLARRLSSYQFIIVGVSNEVSKQLDGIPPNCTIIEPLPYSEMRKYYEKAKIYCQFSLIESFGLSVAEAMAYGCIPVVSNNGALPEIVNNVGYILTKRNTKDAVKIIQEAINSDNRLSIKARKRALGNFSLRRRNMEIVKTIRNL